jgi:cytochrome b561
MQVRTPGAHYDAKTIRLHWLTAGLVIFLWCLGQTIDWFPKGNGRVFARSAHISAGALLGVVLVLRIWWRATGGARLAAVGSGGVNALSTAMHLALYGGLIAAVALGLANTWVRGDNLFNLVQIPAFDPGNKVLRAAVEDYHAFAADLLLILAALHAAAGLAHHYVLKDGILGRMLPSLHQRGGSRPT